MNTKINPDFENFQLKSGEIVFGRNIGDRVLHSSFGEDLERIILLSQFSHPTNISPFSEEFRKSKELTLKLKGIKAFSLKKPVLGIKSRFTPSFGHVKTYSLFRIEKGNIIAEGVRFFNSNPDPQYLPPQTLSPEANLAHKNYFFESSRFLSGTQAVEEFEQIKKNNRVLRSHYR